MNHAYQQNVDNQSEDVQSPDPSYSGMATPFVATQPHEQAVISALLAGVLHDHFSGTMLTPTYRFFENDDQRGD